MRLNRKRRYITKLKHSTDKIILCSYTSHCTYINYKVGVASRFINKTCYLHCYYDINMINVHMHQTGRLTAYRPTYIMALRVIYEYYVQVVRLRLFARETRHVLNGPFCKIDIIILYR